MENASISEELIDVGRRPVPWVLVRRSQESLDEPGGEREGIRIVHLLQ